MPFDPNRLNQLKTSSTPSFDISRLNQEKFTKFDPKKLDTFKTKGVIDKVDEYTAKIANYVFPQGLTDAQFGQDKFNIYGDIGNRIPGFIRGVEQEGLSGGIKGFKSPSSIPSTANYIYMTDETQPTGNKVVDVINATPAAVLGEAHDFAINPFTYIGGILGKSKFIKSELGKATSKAEDIVNPLVKSVSPVVKEGIKNVRLTFGTPVRNFRKFISKQHYTEDDLRNLPLREQVSAQIQKSKAQTILKGQALSKESEGVLENIQRNKEAKFSFGELGKAIKQDISTKKDILRKQKQSDLILQRVNDRSARKVIEDNISMLDDELTKVTQQGAEDIQPLLKNFFKANSKAYGERLDTYSDMLERSNNPLTRKEAFEILDNATSELDSMSITTGRGRNLISNLKQKYNYFGDNGEITKNPGEVINFKDFNKEMRDIFHSTSGTLKSGTKVTEDDLAQIVLHDKYGNYIAEKVPAFQELNQSYRPVINGMKEAGKVFKPYASEFQKTSGAGFFRKVATGKLVPQEERTLQFLEQGSEFAPGIGNISDKAKEVGGNLISKTKELEQTKLYQRANLETMMQKFNSQFNALDEGEREVNRLLAERSFDLSNQIGELEKGKLSIDKMVELNKARGELRQLQLAERNLRVNKLLHIKRKATIIKLAIAGTASVPTGIPQTVGRWALRSMLGDTAANK